ncbi:hypothetical protein L9F63_012488, partial [Diploptera punctata]
PPANEQVDFRTHLGRSPTSENFAGISTELTSEVRVAEEEPYSKVLINKSSYSRYFEKNSNWHTFPVTLARCVVPDRRVPCKGENVETHSRDGLIDNGNRIVPTGITSKETELGNEVDKMNVDVA